MRLKLSNKGFTLVEVCICLLIFMIGALSVAGSIVYARKTLEINKQRLAAMNLARKNMEAIMSHDAAPSGTKSVSLLNSDAYNATVQVEYYGIKIDGSIDWNLVKLGPSLEEPTYARVSVQWHSIGVYDRTHRYSLQALVTKGLI